MINRKKIAYVVDTSVLIDCPDIFFKIGRSRIVVPTAAIRELDGLKNSSDEFVAASARKVSRTLDRLGSSQNIALGAKTSVGSTVQICNRYQTVNDLASISDNKIIGTALQLKKEEAIDITVLSADNNMRNVARAYDLRAEPYPPVSEDPHEGPAIGLKEAVSLRYVFAALCFIVVFLFLVHSVS